MHRRTVLQSGCLGLGGSVIAATATRVSGGSFEPLDRLNLPGAKELVVDGEIAYVATTDGFATVDVSEPTDLEVLAELDGLLEDHPDGPMTMIFDGKVGGDYYVLGGPVVPADGVPHAAVVYDVSDPTDPEHVLTYETEFYNHNLDTDGETLYLCGNGLDGNPLVCVDIDSGEEVGRWSILDEDDRWAAVYWKTYELHDVWVENGVAYCAYWDGGTWLVDVSDPSNPEPIVGLRGEDPEERAEYTDEEAERQRFQLPGNDHFAMPQRGVDSSLVAINEEAWSEDPNAPESELGGVEIWDVDTEESLTRLEPPSTTDATYSGVWTTAHNFDFVGNRLYTSWYRGGIRVHDVSDPTEPQELAHWRETETTSFWTAQKGPDCILASSWRDHSRTDRTEGAAIYAFPDPERPADESPDNSTAVGNGLGLIAGVAGLGGAALVNRLRDE